MTATTRRRGNQKSFRITLRSNPQNIHRVEKFLLKITSGLGIDDERFSSLLVVITEAVNNAIIHGNKRNPAKRIGIVGHIQDGQLVVKVKDEGVGFNPHNIPNPIDEGNLLRESGRGVFLMRQLAEHVSYNEKGNEVTIKMKI
ncbi:MAG TPA: ATP-binding protein [Bacteroidota bacterium]|nr:ATP-binding protein [Bacteroidota bacterium]